MDIHVRSATLDDAPAISAVHCSNITQWRRWDADGDPRPARYADLTAYQRWINGGPWLDPDTCAYHLARRFQGGGIVLVAELKGRVLAEAELFVADEPPPYGRNLNLRNHHGQGLGSALMKHTLALARSEQCDTYTVAHAEAPDFYRRHGLRRAERWVRYIVSTHTSARPAHYLTRPLPDAPYECVRGWAMPIGRYQNAHHEWERARPGAVPDFDEWRHLRLERCWISAGRARAAIIFEERPHSPGVANTFLFTPSRLTPALFSAARDLAARLGFTHLHCFARADAALPGAKPTGYVHQLFMMRLHKPRRPAR
jgi:GNAT superfamily N-acetyltransferase